MIKFNVTVLNTQEIILISKQRAFQIAESSRQEFLSHSLQRQPICHQAMASAPPVDSHGGDRGAYG